MKSGVKKSPEKNGLKRYNLVLPEELYCELQKAADAKHTTVVEMLRRFIKLGLLALRVEETPDSSLVIREGNADRQIMII